MPKLRQPSLKMKTFVHEYIKSKGNAQTAALKAYDTIPKNARKIGHLMLHHPLVQDYMRKVLDRAGATDKELARKLWEIINAGTDRKALKSADPNTALKGLDMILKLKDLYPAEKRKVQTESANINVDLKGKTAEEMMEMLDQVNDEVRKFKSYLKTQASLKAEEDEHEIL